MEIYSKLRKADVSNLLTSSATPPALPEIVGINLPKPDTTETRNDLTTTPASFTNSENQVSQSH